MDLAPGDGSVRPRRLLSPNMLPPGARCTDILSKKPRSRAPEAVSYSGVLDGSFGS